MQGQERVKDRTLELLGRGSRRYTELVNELERPDKTIFVTLRDLQQESLVQKDVAGRYILTEKGLQTLKLHQKLETTTQIEAFEGVTKETVKVQVQQIATHGFYLKMDLGLPPIPGQSLSREARPGFYFKHEEEAAQLDELLSYLIRLAPKLGFKTKKGRWKEKGYYDWANALIDFNLMKATARRFGRREEFDNLAEAKDAVREEILGELVKDLARDVESFPAVPRLETFVAYMKSLVKEIDSAHQRANLQ